HDGLSPAAVRRGSPLRMARARALLPASLTLGNRAKIHGRIRNAVAAATRSHRRAGGAAPARRMTCRRQIVSGEMHYPRVPRAYWQARLEMAFAMGLNTVSTYVFWNLHEPRPQ